LQWGTRLLPVLAACSGLREDFRQQVARPLQAARCCRTECRLHLQRLFLQKGGESRRWGCLIIERLCEAFLCRGQQAPLVQISQALCCRLGIGRREPGCR